MPRSIAFVGPLPPPLHGFSGICAAMLALLRERGQVEVFDRTPAGKWLAGRLLRELRGALRYVGSLRRHPGLNLYLGVSGGVGQLLDALYVALGRAFRRSIVVHHHSFAYVNSTTLASKLLFSQLRRATHIVLSEGMGNALATRYKLDRQLIKVVSNAGFFLPSTDNVRSGLISDSPIRIGFLSNITFDKGFVEFFDVLAQLHRMAVPYEAYIAGPIARDARSTFDRLLAAAHRVEYVGPLYDDAKTRYYRHLDLLLFPTKYANEAEPVVIHEAMRNAVYVIACTRGAIPEILSLGTGLVFEQTTFVSSAATAIQRFSSDRLALARAQRRSYEQAEHLRRGASAALRSILEQLSDHHGSQ